MNFGRILHGFSVRSNLSTGLPLKNLARAEHKHATVRHNVVEACAIILELRQDVTNAYIVASGI